MSNNDGLPPTGWQASGEKGVHVTVRECGSIPDVVMSGQRSFTSTN